MTMYLSHATRVGSCCLLVIALAGCGSSGPETVPVSGTVTADGKAVVGAAVMFMPAGGGRPATGVTDAQGKYQLQTFNANDGAILGEHRVSVTMPETGSGPGTKTAQGSISGSSAPGAAPATMGYEKYAKPGESGLTAQVTRDAKPIDFNLKAVK